MKYKIINKIVNFDLQWFKGAMVELATDTKCCWSNDNIFYYTYHVVVNISTSRA